MEAPRHLGLDALAGLLDDTGLLPVSVSHEGYLAQPVHSYWDDAWAVRGLRDMAALELQLQRASPTSRHVIKRAFSFAGCEALRVYLREPVDLAEAQAVIVETLEMATSRLKAGRSSMPIDIDAALVLV